MANAISFILIFLFLFPVFAQSAIDYNDIQFKVAIYGPSDEIFSWWGHAALIADYFRWNFEIAYDWGINSHPNESYLRDFIDGLIRYKVTSGYHRVESYMEEDRDIAIYTLNLDNKAKEIMLAYVQNRVLPENCYYEYHEFLDNCSTGVRDVLDMGTYGQLKAAFDNIPGRLTYRQQVMRYSWFRPLENWLKGFLMGQNLDKEITVWDEMFLPEEIARNIVDFKYIDSSGRERNLVSSVQLLSSSKNRFPVLFKPLNTWPFFLAAGLFVMVLLFLVKAVQKKHPLFGRIIFYSSQCIFGIIMGLLGIILIIGLSMNTDYIEQNINILFVNPLLLIILPLGILAAVNVKIIFSPAKLLGIIWTCVFLLGCLTMLPFFYQQNQSVCALILPIAFAFSCIPNFVLKLVNVCPHLKR